MISKLPSASAVALGFSGRPLMLIVALELVVPRSVMVAPVCAATSPGGSRMMSSGVRAKFTNWYPSHATKAPTRTVRMAAAIAPGVTMSVLRRRTDIGRGGPGRVGRSMLPARVSSR